MPVIKETTVYDMKTNFSHYAQELLDGSYDEIVIKNRTTPTLRVLPYTRPSDQGLQLGFSKAHGHAVVSEDWDINDFDDEVLAAFDEELS